MLISQPSWLINLLFHSINLFIYSIIPFYMLLSLFLRFQLPTDFSQNLINFLHLVSKIESILKFTFGIKIYRFTMILILILVITFTLFVPVISIKAHYLNIILLFIWRLWVKIAWNMAKEGFRSVVAAGFVDIFLIASVRIIFVFLRYRLIFWFRIISDT